MWKVEPLHTTAKWVELTLTIERYTSANGFSR